VIDLAIARVLEEGTLCAIAATTPRGPHCTPTVFSYSEGRVWVTTSRSAVKARAWRRDPRAAGMVRGRSRSALFTGIVRRHDALDPQTWAVSIVDAPAAALATLRFTRKNARFFAGYAVDARQIPLAWTPPGRVFVSVTLEAAALVGSEGVLRREGAWGTRTESRDAFRAKRSSDPLRGLPTDVAEGVGRGGRCSLAVQTPRGPVVLDAGWVAEETGLFAALREDVWALAGAGTEAQVALVSDRASAWRAKEMVGAMVQGTATAFAVDRLASGKRSASARASAAGLDPEGAMVLRVVPRRLVWWRGWDSGTVAPP